MDVGSGEEEESHLVRHAHGGAMMAVSVDEDFFAELRGLVVGGEFDEEFAEEVGLVAELAGSGIVRKEVGELIAEDAGAGGFEDDDRGVVF